MPLCERPHLAAPPPGLEPGTSALTVRRNLPIVLRGNAGIECSALVSRPLTIPSPYFRARHDAQFPTRLLLSEVPLILFGQRRHELLGHLERSRNDAVGSGLRVPHVGAICNAAATIWVENCSVITT